MYLVTQTGKKVVLDDSQLSEDDFSILPKCAGLYWDDIYLKEVWTLEIHNEPHRYESGDFELEFVKELKYEHEPNQEEILWAMSTYGTPYRNIAFVRKGYEIARGDD